MGGVQQFHDLDSESLLILNYDDHQCLRLKGKIPLTIS